MRILVLLGLGTLSMMPTTLPAQEKPVYPPPVTAPAMTPPPTGLAPKALPPAEFAALSKTIQQLVVQKLPKEFVDNSNWGGMIPAPPKLPLPLLRTYVKVGDHLEVPHGIWTKGKVWIAEPEKDVHLVIKDIKKTTPDTMRVSVETTVNLQGIGDVQHWQKGLATIGFSAQATSTVLVSLELDAKMVFDTSKFPPEIKIEPKVIQSRIDIQEFELFKPGPGPFGDKAAPWNADIKNVLQQIARTLEPQIQEQANQAIAQSMADGKSTLSLSTLLKTLSPPRGN